MKVDDAIRRVRVPQHLAGAPRLRQGLERWLADCEPSRHGLPAEAIVLVRRLSTRWTVVLAADAHTRYGSLAASLAGARRALAGDADADAVWFADEAELMACIARDTLSGVVRERWWWRTLGCVTSISAAASPALVRWLQAPRHVPRAVQRLGPARATVWLASLAPAEQALLLDSLAQAFAVAPEMRDWVLAGALSEPGSRPAGEPLSSRPAAVLVPDFEETAKTTRPIRLHRLCSALVADAGAASTPRHVPRLAASLRSPGEHGPVPARQDDVAARPTAARSSVAAGVAGPPVASRLVHVQGHGSGSAQVDRRSLASARSRPLVGQALEARPTVDGISPEAALEMRPSPPGSLPRRQADHDLAAAPPHSSFRTRHGGLLFLLNAALRLSFYGDFTMPLQRRLDCSPWHLLWLAGRAWCGSGFRRDPLFAWLKRRSPQPQPACPLPIWTQLHARLALALEVAGEEIPPRQRLRAMLGLPARLQDGGERLDLFFPLTELPLAVRLSGLDRDPGWIPAAGCDVRFHFS